MGVCSFSQWRKRITAIARHHDVSARWCIATSGQLARPGRRRQQRGHVSPPVAFACWQRHITAWHCSLLCRLCQWARRSTAMPRHHQAVAWCAWQLWPSLGTVAQPSALPGRLHALRAASWLPFGYRGTVALVRRFAQGVWSVACGQSCYVCPAQPQQAHRPRAVSNSGHWLPHR